MGTPGGALVTGVGRDLGARVARALVESGTPRVIGVDVAPPADPMPGVEFVRADIRGPLVARLIRQEEIETVVHASVIATQAEAGGRVVQKETNVLGSMQLMAAVQRAPSVRRLVVKSTTAVYGASPRDPAVFHEDMSAKVMPRSGFAKDSLEVEGYIRGLARRRPDLGVTILRMANVVGPSVRTALTDYLALPVVATPWGFNGRIQLLHEDDAVAALLRATRTEPCGPVNVAGDGVLTARQAVRLVGARRIGVPMPLEGVLRWAGRESGLASVPSDHMPLLAWGRTVDTARMREMLGFTPRYSTREALLAHVGRGHHETGGADDD